MKRGLLLAIILLLMPACADHGQKSNGEALVRDWMAATGYYDVEESLVFYADDIVWEDPAYGDYFTDKDQVKMMFLSFYTLPDINVEYTSSFVSADGTSAAVEWIWSGTKFGEPYSIRGVTLLTMRDGKIVREIIYYDPTTAPY